MKFLLSKNGSLTITHDAIILGKDISIIQKLDKQICKLSLGDSSLYNIQNQNQKIQIILVKV